VTAHDVVPEWHIRMQAAFQEYVDSAISKTCNFPHDATEEDVREIYIKAYDLGCKGVTVYRDGARPEQVLSTGKVAKEVTANGPSTRTSSDAHGRDTGESRVSESELADTREQLHQMAHEAEELRRALEDAEMMLQKRRQKRSRPNTLRGTTRRMQSPLGDLYVTINEDERGMPFELFCTLGKAGGAAMADVEAIGRLVSLGLRSGIPLSEVYGQLRGISCDRAVGIGPNKVLSVPDAIAQAIAAHLKEKEGVQQEMPLTPPPGSLPFAVGASGTLPSVFGPEVVERRMDYGAYDQGQSYIGTCPECHSDLQFTEGCVKCHSCGYSECG
jgi:ribonucleoside-diphosphate reductase alpha chain